MHTLLDIAGLVKDENRVGVTERVGDIVAQVIADGVGVHFRTGQQMLQPVGSGTTTVFGDRPAILAVQARKQAEHHLASMAQWLRPSETRRDPAGHRRELSRPTIRVY